jgi:signal transduction histidine kinase
LAQGLALAFLYTAIFHLFFSAERRRANDQARIAAAEGRVSELEASLALAQHELVDSGIERGRTETARRAAEELRPPVAALSLILQRLPDLNADSIEAAQGALTKIRAVTTDLLRAAGDPEVALTSGESAPVAEPLLAIVERVLHQRRQALRGQPRIRIESGTVPGFPGPFAKVDPVAFARVLSDLLDNSIAALIASEGRIRLDVVEFPQKGFVELRISDDGVGVPQEVISSLGIKRSSPSRRPGLGLYHAFHRIKEWGGQLTLARRPDRGTVCSIRIPVASAPSWFASGIRIPSGARVLVLEKDPEAMNIWSNYSSLSSLGLTFSLAHRGVDFDALVRESRETRPDLCFVSQELGDELINGLDLIDANRVASRSVLVTSEFENRALRRRAERLGVRVLPKELIEAAVGPEIRHLLRSSADPGLKLGLMTKPPSFRPAVALAEPSGARG